MILTTESTYLTAENTVGAAKTLSVPQKPCQFIGLSMGSATVWQVAIKMVNHLVLDQSWVE